MNDSPLFIGMISGTSRDGADTALVRFEDGRPTVIEALCLPYPPVIAGPLNRLLETGKRPGRKARLELDTLLSEHFARAVRLLLEKAGRDHRDVRAIGSHGQTVWHEPGGPAPESIQLGDPFRIAEQTGITTVGDFRRADMDAGGQGAPLAPLLHRFLFDRSGEPFPETRVVLNLGGIANISIIDRSGRVSGFDTGPANCLMDAWVQKHRAEAYDRNGVWAAGGEVLPGVLRDLLADPYFRKPAPKSTGIEYFNLAWLQRLMPGLNHDPQAIQATLADLTARSVAGAILPFRPGDVLVCGGGVHNADLMRRLRSRLPGIEVKSTGELDLDPDWIEAVLFAWLARERLAGRPADTRSITGAKDRVLLGVVANPGEMR